MTGTGLMGAFGLHRGTPQLLIILVQAAKASRLGIPGHRKQPEAPNQGIVTHEYP